MTTKLSLIKDLSISIDGIISPDNNATEATFLVNGIIQKGEVLEFVPHTHYRVVRTARQNCPAENVAGIAYGVFDATHKVYVYIKGVLRVVVSKSSSPLKVGDPISCFLVGRVCKTFDDTTTNAIALVYAVGDGYVDVKVNYIKEL